MFSLLPLVDTHWVSKSHLGGPSLMNTEDIRAKSAQSRHNEVPRGQAQPKITKITIFG